MQAAFVVGLLLTSYVGPPCVSRCPHYYAPHHHEPPRAAIVESVAIRQVARPRDERVGVRIEKLEERIRELEGQIDKLLDVIELHTEAIKRREFAPNTDHRPTGDFETKPREGTDTSHRDQLYY